MYKEVALDHSPRLKPGDAWADDCAGERFPGHSRLTPSCRGPKPPPPAYIPTGPAVWGKESTALARAPCLPSPRRAGSSGGE